MLATVYIVQVVSESLNDGPWNVAGPFMWPAGDLFASTADIFTLICLVELSISLLHALGVDSFYRVMRYCTGGAAIVLAVLDIVTFCFVENLTKKTVSGSYRHSPDWRPVGKLYGSENIIYWLTSIPTTVLSAVVIYESYRETRLRSVSITETLSRLCHQIILTPIPNTIHQITRRFFVANLLNLTRSTWGLVYAVKWSFKTSPKNISPRYIEVVDPVLNTWVTVVMFGLLIAIGLKRPFWSDGSQAQENSTSNAPPPPAYNPVPAIDYDRYNLYQQPRQAEVVGSAPPAWRPELAGFPAMQQHQQHQWASQQAYQQSYPEHFRGYQPRPIQTQPPVEAEAGIVSPIQETGTRQTGVVHEIESPNNATQTGVGWHRWTSSLVSPQTRQIYEVAGTRDQKS